MAIGTLAMLSCALKDMKTATLNSLDVWKWIEKAVDRRSPRL
jgi:hypothetical protein